MVTRQTYHRITDIVGVVYCEQKVVFDKLHGDASPLDVRIKAATGRFEHLRFQAEGHTRAVVDQRCFIATAIYGQDAVETQFLRAWRDRVLMKSFMGRAFVRFYYAISVRCLPYLGRHKGLASVVRSVLDVCLAWLGMRR
jgi:hypothetical protein